MTAWKSIDEAPYLGEPFLAAVAVHSAHTKEFLHFDYAVLYMDEGRPHFYDDTIETGWSANDYTLCLTFAVPPKPAGGSRGEQPDKHGGGKS